MQYASTRLHETLSSVWRCETPQEHFANISLENDVVPHSTIFRFDIAWTCPTQGPSSGRALQPLRISVEAHSEEAPVVANPSQPLKSEQVLKETLHAALQPNITRSVDVQSTSSVLTYDPNAGTHTTLQDLYTIPNLCKHLGERTACTDSVCCIGFLQKTKTFKHLIYTPNDRPIDNAEMKTLEDALLAAKSQARKISLPEKLKLSNSLAQAVLRFHSTPWLTQEWKSQDVVFLGVSDFAKGPLSSPFLKARVSTSSASTIQRLTTTSSSREPEHVLRKRTPVRNQTLFGLGVMLIELAYDSPLQDLRIPEDDQADSHSMYWAATRLGEDLDKQLGPSYADAVTICLYGGFGASSDLDDPKVQESFYHEVVQKLKKLADAVTV